MEGIGFVQAGCLQEGYELKCMDGNRETIIEVRVEWLEEAVEVYNFEVADYHTYYVGDGDVLVHNKCANPSGSNGNTNTKTYQTYTKYNPTTGEIYSGRTSGTGTAFENVRKRDINHHMNGQGFGPATLDKSSSNYNAIRGREQMPAN